MSDDDLNIKVARLEEKLSAAEKALALAQSNGQAIVAQILSVIAVLISLYATLRR